MLSLTGVSQELKSLVLLIVNVGAYHRCARSRLRVNFIAGNIILMNNVDMLLSQGFVGVLM